MRQTRPRDRTTCNLAPRRKELQCVAHRRPLPIASFVVRSVVFSISRPSTKTKSSSLGTVMHPIKSSQGPMWPDASASAVKCLQPRPSLDDTRSCRRSHVMKVFPIVVFSTVACDREMLQRAQGKQSPSSSDPSRISITM